MSRCPNCGTSLRRRAGVDSDDPHEVGSTNQFECEAECAQPGRFQVYERADNGDLMPLFTVPKHSH
jgi:hypothetical protein